MPNIKISLILCGILLYCTTHAQAPAKQQIAEEENFNLSHPSERIFVHTDKPYYFANDTIWMKGYMVFSADHLPADSSNIVYIELINSAGRTVRQVSTYCAFSVFFAAIPLDKEFESGHYMLRAYTNYERNFGDSLFFTRTFNVYNDIVTGGSAVSAGATKEAKPSAVKRPNNAAPAAIDLQFFAEGGSFIAGRNQQLGFKAVNPLGYATDASGKITTESGGLITTFKSLHRGMGTVWMTPAEGEKYIAVLQDGTTYPLPAVQSSGLQLQVTRNVAGDSVYLKVNGTRDLYSRRFYLRVSCRGISYAKGMFATGSAGYVLALPLTALPSGVCHASIYTLDGAAIAERAFWIWQHEDVKLEATFNNTVFTSRDSVHVGLHSADENNAPVRGSFSAAVIDTTRIYYKQYTDNILSYFLLSSEMKGMVEDPYYYFTDEGAAAAEALMLTQGWVQYTVKFDTPLYAAEKEFSVDGKVTNLLNKPAPNVPLYVFGKDGKRPFVLSTTTDASGNFHLRDLPVFMSDSVSILLNARNKKNKAFGIGITLQEPTYAQYTKKYIPADDLELVSDLGNHLRNNDSILNLYKNEKGVLQAVVVNSKVKVKGSKNLNYDGGSDQVIAQQTLQEQYKSSLLDILYKNVPGFNRGVFRAGNREIYKVNGDIAEFIIDGYNISQYFEEVAGDNSRQYIDYLNMYFENLFATDIVGIEVMSSFKNKMAYELRYHLNSDGITNYAFIEITTTSGNGAFQKNIPGAYYYRPRAPYISRNFYKPKYPTPESRQEGLPDLRTTIHWEPNIVTNEKGEAEFSFYTADTRGGYLVIVQGTDLQGNFGFKTFPLKVGK